MSELSYIRSIEILRTLKPEEAIHICYKFAQISPESFVTAYDTAFESPWMTEVKRLVNEGLKIHAIQLYRKNTNASLLDAKNFVESL